jgi:protein-S-isoprenylcysteine O-methyltransferase Ste14
MLLTPFSDASTVCLLAARRFQETKRVLRHTLEQQGNWLFRWRSFLPLVVLVPMVAAATKFHYLGGRHLWQEAWALFCMTISFCGLGIRALVVGYTPHGTSGRNTRKQVAESLNTDGIYSLCRNPLYLGNYVILLGAVMFFFNWWLVAVVTLAFWLYYERIIMAEEAFLREKFGGVYEDWALTTPAFVPRLRGWRKPPLRFSMRNVLRREYSGFFLIVTAFCGLEITEHVVLERRLALEPHWQAIFLVGLAIYLLLRSLKKYTHVLAVEGR